MLSNTATVQENMVLDLAGRRLVKADRGVTHAARCEKQAGWLPNFLLNHFGSWIFNRLARRCTDDAIWFRGVTQEIAARCDDGAFDLEQFSTQIEPHLNNLKSNLRGIRNDLLRYQLDTSANAKLYRVRATLLVSLTDLFEAVENFRWSLMELEASRAERLSGYTADSPDALDAMLKELGQLA